MAVIGGVVFSIVLWFFEKTGDLGVALLLGRYDHNTALPVFCRAGSNHADLQ